MRQSDLNKLDLCSGVAAIQRKTEGYVTIDIRPFPGVDYVAELGKDPLPFPNDHFEFIRAHDALEHIVDGFFDLMDECWRVLKSGGQFDIFVPRFPSASAIMYPDHFRYFVDDDDFVCFDQALAPGQNCRMRLHAWSSFAPLWRVAKRIDESPSHLHAILTPDKSHG